MESDKLVQVSNCFSLKSWCCKVFSHEADFYPICKIKPLIKSFTVGDHKLSLWMTILHCGWMCVCFSSLSLADSLTGFQLTIWNVVIPIFVCGIPFTLGKNSSKLSFCHELQFQICYDGDQHTPPLIPVLPQYLFRFKCCHFRCLPLSRLAETDCIYLTIPAKKDSDHAFIPTGDTCRGEKNWNEKHSEVHQIRATSGPKLHGAACYLPAAFHPICQAAEQSDGFPSGFLLMDNLDREWNVTSKCQYVNVQSWRVLRYYFFLLIYLIASFTWKVNSDFFLLILCHTPGFLQVLGFLRAFMTIMIEI